MFKHGRLLPQEIPIEQAADVLERVAQAFFTVDGKDSRELMPAPHEPFRRPALWTKYDHLTVKERLDSLCELSDWEKDLFESNISSFGSAPGKDTGFTEALRWFALGGHTMAGVFERAGIWKLGNGGMTSFARAILGEYTGDVLFGAVVKEVKQNRAGATVITSLGQQIKARSVVSTIPL